MAFSCQNCVRTEESAWKLLHDWDMLPSNLRILNKLKYLENEKKFRGKIKNLFHKF